MAAGSERDRIAGELMGGLADWRFRAMLTDWRRCVRSDALPLRSRFDPERISGCLGSIAILELLGDGGFRFRLTGTAIDARLGRNLTGTMSGEIQAPGEAGFQALLARAVSIGAPCHDVFDVVGALQAARPVGVLALPWSAPGGGIQVFAVFSFDAPYR